MADTLMIWLIGDNKTGEIALFELA